MSRCAAADGHNHFCCRRHERRAIGPQKSTSGSQARAIGPRIGVRKIEEATLEELRGKERARRKRDEHWAQASRELRELSV
jgi:hypothetical protein